MTSTKTIKEAFMIRGLIGNLDLSYELIIVHCDSQDAIYLVKIWMYHEKTKHINVKYHFILEIMSHDLISMKKITTIKNHIDMFTNFISVVKFKHCLDLILLCSTLYSLYLVARQSEKSWVLSYFRICYERSFCMTSYNFLFFIMNFSNFRLWSISKLLNYIILYILLWNWLSLYFIFFIYANWFEILELVDYVYMPCSNWWWNNSWLVFHLHL